MSNKIFYTRMQNKIDTYQNWYDNNPVLLDGEIAIVVVPGETGEMYHEPATLMKVGDGETHF